MTIALKSAQPLVMVVDEEDAGAIDHLDAGTAYTKYLHEQVGEFDQRPLGDLVELVSYSLNPKAAGNIERTFMYVDLREVDEISGQILDYKVLPGRSIGSTKKRFRQGDILFARIMPSLANKKIALITDDPAEAVASTEFLVLRPRGDHEVDPFYLFRAIRSDAFTRQAVANVTGATGRQRISPERLLELKVVVPPLELQKQIASTVEEEFRLRALATAERRRADEMCDTVIGPTSLRTTRVSSRAEG